MYFFVKASDLDWEEELDCTDSMFLQQNLCSKEHFIITNMPGLA